jgi:hypothetical protein
MAVFHWTPTSSHIRIAISLTVRTSTLVAPLFNAPTLTSIQGWYLANDLLAAYCDLLGLELQFGQSWSASRPKRQRTT